MCGCGLTQGSYSQERVARRLCGGQPLKWHKLPTGKRARDEWHLCGHLRTYAGSHQTRFSAASGKVGPNNCLLLPASDLDLNPRSSVSRSCT